MKKGARKKFLEWITNRVKENYVFDFRKELVEYCNSDVDILRGGCLELRKLFLEIANKDQFQYITIAAVCISIYRSKYLQENTISVIKDTRQDALNGGEVIICGANVDGFNKTTNTVYQYHGWFQHRCTKCYQEDTINTVNKKKTWVICMKNQRKE